MSSFYGIVAHLIVGRKPEPYLRAVLEAISDVSDHAVINDNSGLINSPNADVILASTLARTGRLTLVRTSFVDFATARNICLDATPKDFAGAWGLFVDADEVHGRELPEMAALLPHLPDDVDAVDGYCRFFIGSFDWWTELLRSRCFVRLGPRLRWSGRIHEQLAPLRRRVALPAQWYQYGHVVMPREEAVKSQLYASLGPGAAPTDAQVAAATPASVWGHLLRGACPFTGQHPDVMKGTITRLKYERATIFAEVDQLASLRTSADRLRNAVRQANASRLLAWRAAAARLRWNWPNGLAYTARLAAADFLRLRTTRASNGRPRYLAHPTHSELYGRVNSTAP